MRGSGGDPNATEQAALEAAHRDEHNLQQQHAAQEGQRVAWERGRQALGRVRLGRADNVLREELQRLDAAERCPTQPYPVQLNTTLANTIHQTTPHLTTHNTPQHDHGTARHDTTRHDTTRHDTARHDTTRHDTTQHDTAQQPHPGTAHNPATTRHIGLIRLRAHISIDGQQGEQAIARPAAPSCGCCGAGDEAARRVQVGGEADGHFRECVQCRRGPSLTLFPPHPIPPYQAHLWISSSHLNDFTARPTRSHLS